MFRRLLVGCMFLGLLVAGSYAATIQYATPQNCPNCFRQATIVRHTPVQTAVPIMSPVTYQQQMSYGSAGSVAVPMTMQNYMYQQSMQQSYGSAGSMSYGSAGSSAMGGYGSAGGYDAGYGERRGLLRRIFRR